MTERLTGRGEPAGGADASSAPIDSGVDASSAPVDSVQLAFPRAQLRSRTVRGVLINALFMGGGEALVLAQGLIVTVLLGPRLIGLYGIVTTTAITVAALRRVGIDEAFVQQRESDQEAEFQRAFTLELIVGGAFSLVLLCAAPIVALVYGDGRLLWLTAAVAYLPTAFALQAPTWIFFRRMDFLRVRALQALVPVVTFCVTVPLAAVGVGVWSLVIGPATGNAVAVVAGIAVCPHRLALRYDRRVSARYLRFSWPVFAAAASLLLIGQGQMLAFTLHGGLRDAGYITLAVTLTRYADRADQIIATTIYPAICVVRDRIDTLREIFLTANRIALIWALPFCAGFILFSPDLVQFVLGHRWRPAIPLLQGLAGAAAIQQLGYNWFSFYRARGDSARQAVEAAVGAAAFLAFAVPGLLVLGVWGFVGGRLAGALLVLAVRRHYVARLLGIELLAVAARGAAPIAAACGLVLAVRALAWSGPRVLPEAICELVLFLACSAALTWAAERGLVRELVGHARAGRGAAEAITAAR
ncbi:MAG: oligosaccharide flippase family protein [Solirubrobacteraceae bacterium]